MTNSGDKTIRFTSLPHDINHAVCTGWMVADLNVLSTQTRSYCTFKWVKYI